MDYKYRAFISYSHADHGWALWLHKALETYKVPKQVIGLTTPVGTVPKKLGRVYRDEAEEGAASELGPRIETALETSDAQIIIASPKSARSQWVDQEIRKFKSLGRETRIFVLIVDGDPNAKDPAQECFPDALKWKAGPDGELSDEPAEPLAVDVRKFGKHDALVRIAAGILGLGYDDLKQRDLQRQRAERRRNEALFGGAMMLFIGAVIAGALSIAQTKNVADQQSLLFAERARQYADIGDERRALLWSLGGLPANSTLLKADDTNARTQFIRSWNSHVALTGKPVQSSDFNSDGSRIIIHRSAPDSVTVKDTETGETLVDLDDSELYATFAAYAGPYYTPADRYIWAYYYDGPALIWDADTGALAAKPADRVDGALMLGNKPRMLIIPPESAEPFITDIDSGEVVSLSGHTAPVRHATATADGTRVVTISDDATARLWNSATGEEIWQIQAEIDEFNDALISADGSLVITQISTAGLFYWDGETGASMGQATPMFGEITPLTISDDGSFLVYKTPTGVFSEFLDYSNTVQFEAAYYDTLAAHILPGNNNVLLFGYFGDVGMWKLSQSGRSEDRARLKPVYRDEKPVEPFRWITHTDVSPDSSRLLIAYGDSDALIWRIDRDRPITIKDIEPLFLPQQAVYSPDNEHLLLLSEYGRARMVTRDGMETVWDNEASASTRLQISVAPDGTSALLPKGNGEVAVTNMRDGGERLILSMPGSTIIRAAYTPNGNSIVTASEDGLVALWDTSSGETIRSWQTFELLHDMKVDQVGKRVMVTDKTFAKTYDLATGELISTINHPGGTELIGGKAFGDIWYADLSPDGSTLATASWQSENYAAYLWDVETGAMVHKLDGYREGVREVRFSPNGKTLLTGSGPQDQLARLWDVDTGRELAAMHGHSGMVFGGRFSPDGTRIITYAADGRAILHDAASGETLAQFLLPASGDAFYASGHSAIARFSPDGERVVVVEDNGTVSTWNGYKTASDMTTSQMLELGCAQIERQGLSTFDIGSPILDSTGIGGESLRNPCDRRGLLSADWWGPTLGNLWTTILPASTTSEPVDVEK